MFTKWLCKAFRLIKRKDIVFQLSSLMFKMVLSEKTLKHKYDTNDISEWSYYKKLWILRGRLQMLEDVIDAISKK